MGSGMVSGMGSSHGSVLSGRSGSQLSPLKKGNLTNLPVRVRTSEVINHVQEILGYTELHP